MRIQSRNFGPFVVFIIFATILPITAFAMHIPPGGGGPPPPYSGTVHPDYYIIHKGVLISGDIEDCQAKDGEFIHFKGKLGFTKNELGVHLFFGEVGSVGADNEVCMKFKAKTYALKYWIYYWDGSYELIPPSPKEAFHPSNTWKTHYLTITDYKAVSDVYIYCTSGIYIPEIRIDYLAVTY